VSVKAKTQAAKLRPIPPPDPGVLVPGASGDVALGRIRRQIEVPRASLGAPMVALAGAAGVAHDAGQLAPAERVMAVTRRLEAADAGLAEALAALAELEGSER
jgi:hypothetical protein